MIEQTYMITGKLHCGELFWECGGIYIYWNDTWETVMLRAQLQKEMRK